MTNERRVLRVLTNEKIVFINSIDEKEESIMSIDQSEGRLPETSRNLLASGTVGSTPLVLVETTGEGLPMPMLENDKTV